MVGLLVGLPAARCRRDAGELSGQEREDFDSKLTAKVEMSVLTHIRRRDDGQGRDSSTGGSGRYVNRKGCAQARPTPTWQTRKVMLVMLKWIGCALLAFCLLVLLTAVLNNMRWAYYESGLLRVDKWTGELYGTGSGPNPFTDTAKYVLLGIAVAATVGLVIGTVAKRRHDGPG